VQSGVSATADQGRGGRKKKTCFAAKKEKKGGRKREDVPDVRPMKDWEKKVL